MPASKPPLLEDYRAPIIEAVISFDCELPPELTLESKRDAVEAVLGKEYPNFKEVLRHERTVTKDGKGRFDHRTARGLDAYRCASVDGKQLVQFRRGGFSFNRLAPYGRLDNYLAAISDAWDAYRELFVPVVLCRISMRYINRIPLPLIEGSVRLRDYFTIVPETPVSLRPQLAGIFQSLRLVCPDTGALAQVTLTTENPAGAELPVILDIDARMEMSEEPPALKTLMDNVAVLRTLKNHLFETSLTDQCQNLFQPPSPS